MKTAFITGITGQDGSHLADLLIAKGYEVHGVIRRSSAFNTGRIMHIYQDVHQEDVRLHLHYGDLTDGDPLMRLLDKIQPDEIYNLGAQSHVRISFDAPLYTADVAALGTLRMLEALRSLGADHVVRFYQASSSEMFGNSKETPQNENTPFRPTSPYACAKVFAFHQACQYREAYGIHASNGILFNHEGPRRGETFVTRKITRGLARIMDGKDQKLFLGNIDAKRDWGYVADYVEAMWLMLQQDEPDDYVIATGKMYSVRDFLDRAFSLVGRDWRDFVEIDPRYFRPSDVAELCGDASKARTKLGWAPSTDFDELVRIMVAADLEAENLDPTKYGL